MLSLLWLLLVAFFISASHDFVVKAYMPEAGFGPGECVCMCVYGCEYGCEYVCACVCVCVCVHASSCAANFGTPTYLLQDLLIYLLCSLKIPNLTAHVQFAVANLGSGHRSPTASAFGE